MNDIINPILQWLNANPELAGLVTFIISAAESVAVIGTIVPGSIMMTALGTLAGAGVIPLWQTLIWAALGAIVGDGISYWLGYYFKERIHQVWPFRSHPDWLRGGELFFHKHGGMSVFIGRFIGPVRALVPLVAGTLGMRPLQFYLANIFSAILWAPIYMLPGILLGAASLELPPDIAVHVILMLLLTGIFFFFCGWMVWKVFFAIGDQINHWLNNLWSHLKKSRAGNVITFTLKHYNPQKTHGQLALAFYLLVVSGLFVWLGLTVLKEGPQAFSINQACYYFFRSLHSPLLNHIMLWITYLGERVVASSLFLILFAWLIYTRRFYAATHILALFALALGVSECVKHFVHSPRPTGLLQSPNGFSFPSGHTTLSTTLYIGFALLLSTAYSNRPKWPIVLGILMAFVVGVSRLYLEAHWLTDVVGGFLLGSALLILVTISFNRKKVEPSKPLGLLSVFLAALIIMLIGFNAVFGKQLRTNYTLLDYATYTTTSAIWFSQTDNKLPRYRLNRFGLANQVLNVQWMGNLDDIKRLLLANGWEEPPERDWINVILRLADVQSEQHIPLVSPLYLDKKPVLVLIKPNANKNLIILRLWDSHVVFKNTTTPLWVGTIELVPRTYHWLMRKKDSLVISPNLLFLKTPSHYSTREIRVNGVKKSKPQQMILLIKPN